MPNRKYFSYLCLFVFFIFSSAPLYPESIAKSRPTLLCCGGQGTIFGSCYLLDTCEKKIVLDCGLFSEPEQQKKNFYFPFDPKKVDAALISHVHADHIGKLPLLYRKGFEGPTYCTAPTKAMSETALPLSILNLSNWENGMGWGRIPR
ncbi:MAG: MBL fold metallo-hydrolase [bacterium]